MVQSNPQFPETFSSLFLTGFGMYNLRSPKSVFVHGFTFTLSAASKSPLELMCRSGSGPQYSIKLTPDKDGKVWTGPVDGVEIKQKPA